MTDCVDHRGVLDPSRDRSTPRRERSRRNAPPSIHSKVARPLPADRPSTKGSNSQVPARRSSGDVRHRSGPRRRLGRRRPRRGSRRSGRRPAVRPSSMPKARSCSIASVLGKVLTIDIRVRPAPTSSIVTRNSVHRHVGVRRAVLVGEAVADGEGARGIDLLDLPVAVRLVALGSGHVVLDTAAGLAGRAW